MMIIILLMRMHITYLFYFSSRRRHMISLCDWSSDVFFFFSSRRRHTRSLCDWSSDVCSSDLDQQDGGGNDGRDRRNNDAFAVNALHRRPLAAGRVRRDEAQQRSEERRVGKECRSRWSPYH